jgi:hypothetical protein
MSSANKWALGVETTQARTNKQNKTKFGQNYLFHKRNMMEPKMVWQISRKCQNEECFPFHMAS